MHASLSTTLLLLALCAFNAFSQPSQAQIVLYDIGDSTAGHLARILDGSFWSTAVDASLDVPRQSRQRPDSLTPTQRYLNECEEARSVWRAPESANPARVRRDAIRTFRSCVENERALLVARDTRNAVEINASVQPLLNTLEEDGDKADVDTQFIGLSFGVGIGASYSGDDRISQAEVGANGNIRSLSDETQEPRVILESHYYGWCKSDRCNAGEIGIGPFFGIVAKDDKLISALALGVMFGWKDADDEKNEGFSVGLGAILDSGVISLAEGFEVGQPLPAGEDAPVFQKESRWGAVLFFTRTF